MRRETRIALVEQACRHASNIVVEVLGNHAHIVPYGAREQLKVITAAFFEVKRILGRELATKQEKEE